MESTTRWTARPLWAAVLRSAVFLGPMALSATVVLVALAVLPLGGSSVPVLVASWIGLGAVAAVVMLAADRFARRLLPVAALMRLSLVLPDEMPSRFATASERLTPEELEREVAHARAGSPGDSSADAAARLLRLVAELADHDALTRGHSDRVRVYSQIIGQSLGLSDDDLDRLNWAALLHDVGKMAVPGEVLNKRGRPSDDEWEQLKAHADEGARMAAPLADWLGEWFPAISQHHERWDGTGYPAGLAGEEISLAGRIVAVADAYDVMTSDRTYADARSRADALEELASCSGSHFDPVVVRAMLDASTGLPRFAYGSGAWFGPLPVLGRLASLPSLAPTTASTILASAAIVGAGTLAPGTLSAAVSLVAPPPAAAPASAAADDAGPGIDTGGMPPAATDGRDPARDPESAPPAEESTERETPSGDWAPARLGGAVPATSPGGSGDQIADGPGPSGGDGGTGPPDPDPQDPGPDPVTPPIVEDVTEAVKAVAPPIVEEVVDAAETLVPTEQLPDVPVPSPPELPVELPDADAPVVPPVSVPEPAPGGGVPVGLNAADGAPPELPLGTSPPPTPSLP